LYSYVYSIMNIENKIYKEEDAMKKIYNNTMLIKWRAYESAEFKNLSPEAAKILTKGFKDNPEWLEHIKEIEWVCENEKRRIAVFTNSKESGDYRFELYKSNGVIGKMDFRSMQDAEKVCETFERLYAGEFDNLDWKF
ncbi:MAG: hypothetical protein LUD81_06095, partial [Clostridiales bacterium]|nr:hypothetical protein [Clostridiales bacterium]